MDTIPTAFRLLPFGRVELDQPLSGEDFTFTRAHAAQALSAFRRDGRELGVDYEHQTYRGVPAPAAGWIGDLEVRGDGLYATRVQWTPPGRAALLAGRKNYISPVVFWRGGLFGGCIERLGLPALTDNPAICGAPPLMASRGSDRALTACRPMLLSRADDGGPFGVAAVEEKARREAVTWLMPRIDGVAQRLMLAPGWKRADIERAIRESDAAMEAAAGALGIAPERDLVLNTIADMYAVLGDEPDKEDRQRAGIMAARRAVIDVGRITLSEAKRGRVAMLCSDRAWVDSFLRDTRYPLLSDAEAAQLGLRSDN